MSNITTVNCLNVDTQISTTEITNSLSFQDQQTFTIDAESIIISDCDAELLILIEFTEVTELKSMKIYALQNSKIDDCGISPPTKVHIFKTDDLNYNFEDIQSMQSDKSIKCSIKKLQKGQCVNFTKDVKCTVKFKKVKYLAIYIQCDQADTEKTYINGISFKRKMNKHSILFDETYVKHKHELQQIVSEISATDPALLELNSSYLLHHHRSHSSNKQIQKSVQSSIKPPISMDEIIIYCICGIEMQYVEVQEAYPSQNTLTVVQCDVCNRRYRNQHKIYHCTTINAEVHRNGYDLCQKCAEEQYMDYNGSGSVEEQKLSTANNEVQSVSVHDGIQNLVKKC